MSGNPNSLTQRINALLEQGRDVEYIATKLRCTKQRVQEMRSKWRKPSLYRHHGEVQRRREGIRPIAKIRAEQRARAAERLATIKPLLKRGLSWGKAAKELGITRNVIAGLLWKERQRKGDATGAKT